MNSSRILCFCAAVIWNHVITDNTCGMKPQWWWLIRRETRCLNFFQTPDWTRGKSGAVSGVYFAGFVFCYTERFVFVDQGAYWSAVCSTVWAALQAGVGGRCLGLGDLDPALNLSPAAAHYCAVEAGWCREPRESQKIISVHCKLSNPVTSMVMTYEHPQRIPMSNLKPIWMITRC